MTADHATTANSQPWLHQRGREIQEYGTVRQFPLAPSTPLVRA